MKNKELKFNRRLIKHEGAADLGDKSAGSSLPATPLTLLLCVFMVWEVELVVCWSQACWLIPHLFLTTHRGVLGQKQRTLVCSSDAGNTQNHFSPDCLDKCEGLMKYVDHRLRFPWWVGLGHVCQQAKNRWSAVAPPKSGTRAKIWYIVVINILILSTWRFFSVTRMRFSSWWRSMLCGRSFQEETEGPNSLTFSHGPQKIPVRPKHFPVRTTQDIPPEAMKGFWGETKLSFTAWALRPGERERS